MGGNVDPLDDLKDILRNAALNPPRRLVESVACQMGAAVIRRAGSTPIGELTWSTPLKVVQIY